MNATVLAETKDLGFDAEIAAGRVVESVVLEGAGSGEAKAKLWETRLK